MRKVFILFVFAIAFTTSCSEDETLTPGELTGKKIKEVVKKEGIEIAYVYMNDRISLDQSNVPFKIEGSFLITYSPNATYYDLNKLVSFRPVGGSEKRINFYFE